VSDELLPDRWYAVDLPVLRAVVQGSLSEGSRLHQIAQETIADLGLDTREHVGPCLRRLHAGRYITTNGKDMFVMVTGVTEKALGLTGVYPNAEAERERLRAIIEAELERTAEGPERTRLESFLTAVSQGVAVGVINTWLKPYL
jgi:hypothetical protein